MYIAQIAPLCEAVPPLFYGGTERVIAYLCDALVALGHDVTLFAAAGSRTRARLVAVRDRATRLDATPLKCDLSASLTLLSEAKQRAARFDILHFHTHMLHFPMFEPLAHRTVTTLHGRVDLKDLPAAYARWPGFGLVSLSQSQRKPLPGAHWLATVGHGLPASHYTFTASPEGSYLAFLGRIAPEKRPDLAVRLALRARVPLRLAAKVDDTDRAFFEAAVKPLLVHPGIEFLGEIDDTRKSGFLGNARALLFPIDWPEPFGLVMIEAFACGTPVIAWNRGSVPEIIDEGVTGFIVDSEEAALQAIARVQLLDRKRIREVFERRFSATAMARAYVEVYTQVLDETQRPAVQTGWTVRR
jgi:glycosyltransferase involved in cell wall biosynthesis